MERLFENLESVKYPKLPGALLKGGYSALFEATAAYR